MNRRTFNQHIADSNFKELFISEMGWNNPHGQTEFKLEIDETLYTFQIIAERNGFQVLTCEVREIPKASLCKKMDTQMLRSAYNYICIFHLPNESHHLWAVPVRKVEKRDIVLVEYISAETAGFLFEKVEGLSFGLDEQTTITDVVARVHSAFIINSERITKDFYSGFKKEHSKFVQFISGIDDRTGFEIRNKEWYTSVMLNRLMFCYFIQKKGFLDGDVDYLRHKLEWTQREKGKNRFFNSFYKGFLITLFHGGLNKPKHDAKFEEMYGRIPYLNGGMFDVHQLEQEYKDLDIADEAFISLFDFFDKWHWHLDDRITATGRDINPDVLGYIFEQYVNDRAQMGAYYTKEDITEYIGRNTILPYLVTNCISQLDNDTFIWQSLQQSGDRYIFDAVKKGSGLKIPEEIAIGLGTTKPNLLERRKRWNDRTPECFALPTEIWRETIERLQRYESVKAKIENGEIRNVNDFITYNLDIRSFVYDLLNTTDNPQLIKRFYAELQKITILDPTCGSGAFLFAALNILEPLYEVCITRMQEFQQQNPDLFGVELDEINHQYRSNIRYFIYKSIILRNLYGVDIMVEATEIAKLRLFLKMVAVVDVDKRDPNLGLDPLPDIDFNIRCGNTLVGYATEKALEDDLDYGDPFAAAELRPLIHEKMAQVSETYQKFRDLQLIQTEEPDAFKRVKGWLKEHLSELNDLLNRKLYQSTTSEEMMTYEQWLCSHQPFHWLAEFYEIINDHGGFDVIIGNPPYVEYTRKEKSTGKSIRDYYKITGYKTELCSNLYAFVVERSMSIAKCIDNIGFIVPLTIASNNNMRIIRDLLCESGTPYFSHFEIRPAKLFEGVEQRLTIFILKDKTSPNSLFSTSIVRWKAEQRHDLFKTIHYAPSVNDGSIWRTSSELEIGIYNKFKKHHSLSNYTSQNRDEKCQICYRTAGVRYWIMFLHDGFNTESLSNKTNYFQNSEMSYYYMSVLNSNLFWWYYSLNYDMFNLKDYMIFSFRLNYEGDNNLELLSRELEKDLNANKELLVVNSKTRGTVESFVFRKKLSKPIIDKIDKALAKHYGFTEEELDFIINYDIKYRMGDELNEE